MIVTNSKSENAAGSSGAVKRANRFSKNLTITYWRFNYEPGWEAGSKEMQLLAMKLSHRWRIRIVGLNQRGKVFRRENQTLIIPAVFALVAPFFLKFRDSSRHINHVFASAGERFLIPRMDAHRTMLTVSKPAHSLAAIEQNLTVLRRLRYVVVESERDREILRLGGVPDGSLKLIHPGAEVQPYRPAEGQFTILFATSPTANSCMLERGIHLMVQVAKSLQDVRFLLVWRNAHFDSVKKLIAEAETGNVEVRNGMIRDMGAVYDSVHATILPGLEHGSLKPSPQSALDSLAHGKPLLASTPTSISGVVMQNRCGVVFEPAVDALKGAIILLKDRYSEYQKGCHSTVREHFSPRIFLERYQRIYETVGQEIG
jgi:glycosyltransferase involved in cell wall biosynthesis